LQQIAEWYASDSHTRVTIFDAQGSALADSSYARDKVPNELARPEIQAAIKSVEKHDIRADSFSGEMTLFTAAPIRQGNRLLGTVRMAQPMSLVVAPARMLLINLAVAGIVAVVLVSLFGLWSGRRLVAPLRRLETTALAVGGGDLSQQAIVDSTDEIGALADAFNYMMEELRRLIDSQRTFIANASHELRTPLANIKLRSEALIDIGDEDPELTRRYIHEIDGEADRMGRLANTLLDLARLEAQPRSPAHEAVDVTPTLFSVARAMRLRMRQAQLSFIVHIPTEVPPLAVWTDQLEAIIFNLLDNAIRYTPPGGEVRFEVSVTEGRCILRVQDNGPGIPAEDLPRIFDRFYRVDKARSRQAAHFGIGSGSGLGLSIAKALAEANGGTLQVESTPGHGTTFMLSFPTI
jgi:signal transduction histidine kinase